MHFSRQHCLQLPVAINAWLCEQYFRLLLGAWLYDQYSLGCFCFLLARCDWQKKKHTEHEHERVSFSHTEHARNALDVPSTAIHALKTHNA